MTVDDLAVLRRAHDLFADPPRVAPVGVVDRSSASPPPAGAAVPEAYLEAAAGHRAQLAAARDTDTELAGLLERARNDHADGHRQTATVLAAARSDSAAPPTNPIAHRELLRRRAARLRAQHAHVRTARRRARIRLAALRALRYRVHRRTGLPNSRAGAAVRAALSRLGCPYVWGAAGPDRFDCSGLVQWAYARAGVTLDRTTYDQINDGVPVARSQVRPGDLVFPHAGHVQLAIGNDLVVEAPHAGADVRISRLGTYLAIRRPLSP